MPTGGEAKPSVAAGATTVEPGATTSETRPSSLPDGGASPALAEALATVGDRWTLLIVASLLSGAKRFGELEQDLGGIAPNVLSSRLRQLTEQRLVLAEPYSRRPERFVYELTEAGRGLAGSLRMLTQWGARQTGAAPAVHAACGNPLEAVWYCPACSEPVADDQADELDYA